MAVILFCPPRFDDGRGWFSETYNKRREADLGITTEFVQENQSLSARTGTLRGIHFQSPPHAQAKLVRCTKGRILDVVVDLRRGSPTFGGHVTAELSLRNGRQIFIPAGFGHGFITREPGTEVAYKVDDYYDAGSEGGLRWDCPDLAIDWGLDGQPAISDRDAMLPSLSEFDSPFDYDGQPLELVIR